MYRLIARCHMKTVQVSTVKIMSDVEVIFVNSKFAIEAFRSFQALQDVRQNLDLNQIGTNVAYPLQQVESFLNELLDALEDDETPEQKKMRLKAELQGLG